MSDDIQGTFDTIESQRQRITELEAKVAELEERNANQAAEIEKLRRQLETRDAELGRWRGDEQPHPLGQWWMDKAAAEVEPLIAKMTEYGGEGRAVDLHEIGRALLGAGVQVPNPGTDDITEETVDEVMSEMGIYFYLVGKFSRWQAAVAEGRRVSDDTLLDIGIYVRMAQRIREVGGWPK
jgi:cell division septum initiation protein DivIVA